jgi:hypothetical protein
MSTPYSSSPSPSRALRTPGGSAVIVSPNKRGVVLEADPAVGCICSLCSCGKHRCPRPQSQAALKFDGISESSAAFVEKSCPVHAAPVIDHARFVALPFTAQSTYAHDFIPWQMPEQVAPTSPQRVPGSSVKFDARSEAASAFVPPPPLEAQPAAAPQSPPQGVKLPFTATSTYQSDFVPMPLQAPPAPQAPPPAATSRLPFSATSESAAAFKAWPLAPAPEPAPVAAARGFAPKFEAVSESSAAFKAWPLPAPAAAPAPAATRGFAPRFDAISESAASFLPPPIEPPCPVTTLPQPPLDAAWAGEHVLYDTAKGAFSVE